MKPYYQDDLITLYHGDCLGITEWLDADVLVTDPTYGIAWASNTMHYDRTKAATKNAVKNDESTMLRDSVLQLWQPKPAIVFGTWKIDRPKNTKHRLIWHKTKMNPGMSSAPWFTAEEEIYVLGSGFTGKAKQNVYPTLEARGGQDGLSAQTGHPTPKPIGLMEALIAKCPDGVIADPFAGSGATLLAARNLGRQVIGIELEERYCELIAKRASQSAFDFSNL